MADPRDRLAAVRSRPLIEGRSTIPRRPIVVLLLAVVAALATACGPSAQVEQAEVTAALQAVADWLAVDDDPAVTTEQATDRARWLVAATQPLVEARPPVEGLDADQTREFHDALTALRDSVAAQREVLADCTLPDPATCLAQSDLDPADLTATVERFQSALDPLLDAVPTPAA